MKTRIILATTIVLLFGSSCLNAQKKFNPELRPFSEFVPDTIAYLEANFGEGAPGGQQGSMFYSEKASIGTLLDDLDIRFKSVTVLFTPSSPKYVVGFTFRIHRVEEVAQLRRTGKKIPGLTVPVGSWKQSINITS